MLRRGQIDELPTAVGADGLITGKSQLQTYECDALTNFQVMPDAVVLPRTAGQVQAVVRLCARDRIPFVSRGAGTGLSGGALPAAGGIVISLARMNRILEVDFANRQVVVEPGVINAHVTQRVAARGYFYAPDLSSQSVCTIGGNVAENAGGAHCLKYGFTTTHVLALDVVLPSGELVMRALQGGDEGGNGYWRIRAASRLAEDGTVVADRRIFDSRGPHGKVAASCAAWNHI
jgi:glycolate oxidase